MSGRGQPRGRGGGGSRGSGSDHGRGGGRGGGSSGGRGGSSDGGFRGGRGGYGGGPSEPMLFNPPGEQLIQPAAEVRQAEDALIASKPGLSMAGLNISGTTKMPRRPAYAKMGRPIVLRANYFHILPNKDIQLFRYHVDFKPEAKATRLVQRVMELFLAQADFFAAAKPAIATDGRSTIVTLKKLKLGAENRAAGQILYYEAEDAGPRAEKPKTYEYAIAYTNTLSVQELMDYLDSRDITTEYEPKEAVLQALNLAMMRKPLSSADVAGHPSRNKYFPFNAVLGNLGAGLVALRGYYTSVRTATLRLLLNVNSITATFFQSGSLSDVMVAFKQAHTGPGTMEHALQVFLKGVRVECTHLPSKNDKGQGRFRVKPIQGLAWKPRPGANAREVTFFYEDAGKEVTVENYYKRKYNITLSKWMMPIVNCGRQDRATWMPPELCMVIPGQVARKKLSPNQTAEMIKVACRRPAANAKLAIGEGAQLMGLGPGHQDGPTLFGLKINPQMITVDGRILMAPSLTYGSKQLTPSGASWNMASQKFCLGARVRNWSFFKIRSGRDSVSTPMGELAAQFRQMMIQCGMTVDQPTPLGGFPDLNLDPGRPIASYEADIEAHIARIRAQNTARLLLVALPNKSIPIYSHLKFYADVKHGLHTICCTGEKLSKDRGRDQLFANLALKVNLKLGGVNQAIPPNKLGNPVLANKAMIVGIDVTHPSPDSRKGAPSVAGVVASINDRYAQWPASVRVQTGRQEMVGELAQMMVERLRAYQKNNMQALPQNIVVYRDGVSEGQYQIVLNEESPAIDKAIAEVYGPKVAKPKVSIIIVGKRHHTRFYPTTENDMDIKSGNPKNGTVVDRGVTSERHWDFFLQAHTGLQGTARPAHYVVVQDRIGLGADGLEQMTHNLCYLFGRATKAVSICPPAYYADLLCERARCYLYETFNDNDAATNTGSTVFDVTTARWTSGVHVDLRDSMFYI
ncbi:MAG: hypothetical protein M1823_000047 [Watsoniomyces obsoletus]|nr:MAG: hypothetical protein M1823_000047 [Watsoniomyces obsoletus]